MRTVILGLSLLFCALTLRGAWESWQPLERPFGFYPANCPKVRLKVKLLGCLEAKREYKRDAKEDEL